MFTTNIKEGGMTRPRNKLDLYAITVFQDTTAVVREREPARNTKHLPTKKKNRVRPRQGPVSLTSVRNNCSSFLESFSRDTNFSAHFEPVWRCTLDVREERASDQGGAREKIEFTGGGKKREKKNRGVHAAIILCRRAG